MSEKDFIVSSQSIAEPSTKPFVPGMTRIRVFKIWAQEPAEFDAIINAFDKVPEMPVISIPRAAVGMGKKVEVVDIDVPIGKMEEAQESILRGDGIRALRRPKEAVIVYPLQIQTSISNLENLPPQANPNLDNLRQFIRPLTNPDWNKEEAD